MESFNIYLTGVGGQGIGLISEVILRAADHAGQKVKSVDTHGLAQRGGIVVSQIRMGTAIYTPIIPLGEADMVIALERHEALRGMNLALKDNGILVYYNTVQQPLEIRLTTGLETSEKLIRQTCKKRQIREIRVRAETILDPRMQNMVLLSEIDQKNLIPSIKTDHYKLALDDLLTGSLLEINMQLFESS